MYTINYADIKRSSERGADQTRRKCCTDPIVGAYEWRQITWDIGLFYPSPMPLTNCCVGVIDNLLKAHKRMNALVLN